MAPIVLGDDEVQQFVASYNKTAAPFIWKATADSILEQLQPLLCSQLSGTGR